MALSEVLLNRIKYQVLAAQTKRTSATPPSKPFRIGSSDLFTFAQGGLADSVCSFDRVDLVAVRRPRLRKRRWMTISPEHAGLHGAVNFLLFEYRIESKPHDRPAPIGPLQVGYAADSRRFRSRHALVRSFESRSQTCHRTSRRAPRRLSGSALGPSSEACGALRRTTTADRSSLARARSEHLAPPCHRYGPRDRRRRGDGQAVVFERILYSQPPKWRKHSGFARTPACCLCFPGQRLLGVCEKFSVRQLPARIHHEFEQAENRLRLPRRQTSHGRKPLQPHGV